MMKQYFDDLIQKDMDRKEFLAYVGAGMLALTGVSAFIKTMTGSQGQRHSNGYGGGAYGGTDSPVSRPRRLN